MTADTTFEKVAGLGRKSDRAAEQILSAVKTGRYREGEKLPSERELSEIMGVGRNSVREALCALSIAGVVRTRVGDGTYVAASARRTVSNGIGALQQSGIDVLDIWRAKEEIEVLLLKDAIQKATRDEVEMLSQILADMREAALGGIPERYSLSNIAFHLHIAGIAGQSALRRAENLLLRVTQQIYRLSDVMGSEFLAEHLYRAYITHKEILRVLQARKDSEVELVMREHFKEVRRYLEHVFGDD